MDEPLNTQVPIWMGVLVTTAILFSFALACGMPFAALGAVAALVFGPRDALWLAGAGWLANQVIGFGFLGYPFDAMTLAWGVALGLSAVTTVGAAYLALRRTGVAGYPRLFVAFAAAWIGQQGTVLLASFVLGGTTTAFAPDVVWFILWTNALAFAVLVAAQKLGASVGLVRPLPLTS